MMEMKLGDRAAQMRRANDHKWFHKSLTVFHTLNIDCQSSNAARIGSVVPLNLRSNHYRESYSVTSHFIPRRKDIDHVSIRR